MGEIIQFPPTRSRGWRETALAELRGILPWMENRVRAVSLRREDADEQEQRPTRFCVFLILDRDNPSGLWDDGCEKVRIFPFIALTTRPHATEAGQLAASYLRVRFRDDCDRETTAEAFRRRWNSSLDTPDDAA